MALFHCCNISDESVHLYTIFHSTDIYSGKMLVVQKLHQQPGGLSIKAESGNAPIVPL